LTLAVIATTLIVYVGSSSTPAAIIEDSDIASGAPGFVIVPGTSGYGTAINGSIAIYETGLVKEETVYSTCNFGTLDSQGRTPFILELSTDSTPNTATYLMPSGGTNPAAGKTTNIDIANAWLKASGVIS
jgi:hypothetical protein